MCRWYLIIQEITTSFKQEMGKLDFKLDMYSISITKDQQWSVFALSVMVF